MIRRNSHEYFSLLCALPPQIRRRLMVSDKGHLEWKKMYFKLSRCYPHREQYSDTLHFCTHCHILFWKVVCLSPDQSGYEAEMRGCTQKIKKRETSILMCVFFSSQDTNHPCTANNPESCTTSLSPQDFIKLFNFWPAPNPRGELTVYSVDKKMYNIILIYNSLFLDIDLAEVWL